MSENKGGNNDHWDSCTEEEDAVIYDTRFNMRLREPVRNPKQPAEIEQEISAEPRKRGRGPSKRPCLNRNALMARENRLKKKAYLEKIESKLEFYQQDNNNLRERLKKQDLHMKQLSSEVKYLKSVLHNNTSITALLKTINDSLQKINVQKKLMRPNHTTECPDKTIPQQTPCNPKEETLGSPNKDIFVENDDSNSFMEHSVNESQSTDSYVDSRRLFTCKNIDVNQISFCSSDSDHTYTGPTNSAVDTNDSLPDKERTNTVASTMSSMSEDSCMDNAKDPLLPIAEADLPSREKKEPDIAFDYDQLLTFNMDMFEDLPKCDIMSSVAGLNDPTNLFAEDDMSQTLDNTGICLHVNSDKVSLEFCSICHSNSKTRD